METYTFKEKVYKHILRWQTTLLQVLSLKAVDQELISQTSKNSCKKIIQFLLNEKGIIIKYF